MFNLLDANGALYNWMEFKTKYNFNENIFFKCFQLCHALPGCR